MTKKPRYIQDRYSSFQEVRGIRMTGHMRMELDASCEGDILADLTEKIIGHFSSCLGREHVIVVLPRVRFCPRHLYVIGKNLPCLLGKVDLPHLLALPFHQDGIGSDVRRPQVDRFLEAKARSE